MAAIHSDSKALCTPINVMNTIVLTEVRRRSKVSL